MVKIIGGFESVPFANTFLVALAFSIIMMLALVCVPSIRRKSPHNLIFLGLFTLCEGWLIGNFHRHQWIFKIFSPLC